MKTCTLVLALFLLAFGSFSSAQSNLPRIRFMSYDINPKNPNDITVAITTLDTGKTHFFAIGAKIPGTIWVIKGFTKKESAAADGKIEDSSEVTIEDAATKEAINVSLSNKPIELKLAQFKFVSYDIDPKKPKNITFGIKYGADNVESTKTHYLAIGAQLPGTRWTIKSFEKRALPVGDGVMQDASELTLENPTTKATLVLTLNKFVDSGPRQ